MKELVQILSDRAVLKIKSHELQYGRVSFDHPCGFLAHPIYPLYVIFIGWINFIQFLEENKCLTATIVVNKREYYTYHICRFLCTHTTWISRWRPNCSAATAPRKWWKYAITCTLDSIHKHRYSLGQVRQSSIHPFILLQEEIHFGSLLSAVRDNVVYDV